jgi:hypothetical protein
MTTLTDAPALRAAAVDTDAPIRFARLVRVELRKLVDTRAGRWLLIAIAAITPIVIVVMLFAAKPADLTYTHLIDYTQSPQKILLPALGILAMTSEWGQRTGLVTFTLVPRRRRVLLAKFTSVLALGLIVTAIAFATAALGNLLAPARGGTGSWDLGAADYGHLILAQLIGLVEGMAFGMALLLAPAAIVLYYVVPTLWTVLFSSAGALKHVAPWIDLDNAQGPLFPPGAVTGSDWAHLLVAATLWVALPLVAGTVRVSRTEVKSG